MTKKQINRKIDTKLQNIVEIPDYNLFYCIFAKQSQNHHVFKYMDNKFYAIFQFI
jgi:hypothetical protein